jgi:DNA repair photolyase
LVKKRGSQDRRVGRFGQLIALQPQALSAEASATVLQTQTRVVQAKSILNSNNSPDIPWSKTINPYQGCEHGCSYCYARPSHAYHNLSPGLDFETQLFAKSNAADLLRQEFMKAGYKPTTIAVGTNTDAYQPIERTFGITRQLLQLMLQFRHPVSVLTKSNLITRDIDLLSELAALQLVEVHFSLTSLRSTLAKKLEPRATLPGARLEAIRLLSQAGIPVKAMFAPLIPGLNDAEMADLMLAVKQAGAQSMGYILLRLPYEVQGIFSDWLAQYYPSEQGRILEMIRQSWGDMKNGQAFSSRMTGQGLAALELKHSFERCFTELGFKPMSPDDLTTSLFTKVSATSQLSLF